MEKLLIILIILLILDILDRRFIGGIRSFLLKRQEQKIQKFKELRDRMKYGRGTFTEALAERLQSVKHDKTPWRIRLYNKFIRYLYRRSII